MGRLRSNFPDNGLIQQQPVKSALAKAKKIFGPAANGNLAQENCAIRARNGAAPFGFEIIDCRLIENPREIKVVQKIIDQWNAGHGFAAIARELNRSKLKTRRGKAWDHSVVSAILRRIQEGSRQAPYQRFSGGAA